MAIRLEKGQRINLEKDNGTKLTTFVLDAIGELLPLRKQVSWVLEQSKKNWTLMLI